MHTIDLDSAGSVLCPGTDSSIWQDVRVARIDAVALGGGHAGGQGNEAVLDFGRGLVADGEGHARGLALWLLVIVSSSFNEREEEKRAQEEEEAW